MTKPHAQAKSGSARPAQSANQKDMLPLEQMMTHEISSNLGTNTQSEAQQVSNDSKDNVLVPALRFEGFSDPVRIFTLEQLTICLDNKRVPLSQSVREKQRKLYDYYGATGVIDRVENFIFDKPLLLVIEDGLTKNNNQNQNNAIIASGKYWVNNHTHVLDTNGLSKLEYLLYYINSISLTPYITGTAQLKLNQDKLRAIPVPCPNIAEQERIGALFKELDRNLSLNRAQLEKLTQLKTSMLEQMFPQEGEDVPRLRFDGFTEPWQQHQLRDIAQIIGGGTPSTSIKSYWDGPINWFTPAELGDQVFVSHSERQITQQGVEQSSAKLLPQGTVLFTSRAGIGKTAILTTPSTTNQGFQSIVPDPKLLDSYFIFSCTNQLKAYGENVGGGSTFKEVSGKQMEVMYLLIPSLTEQERIGAFFQALDERLALQRAKIEKLEQLKKALLEQMFV